MEDYIDLDLTTEEGQQRTKQLIKESLIKFDEKDKAFIGNLLYIMLNTISEQQVRLETIEEFLRKSNN